MKKLLLAVVLCLFVIPVGADESSKQIPLTSGSVYDAIRETDFDVNICLESNDYYQNELVLDKMISSTSETVIKQTFFTICRAINAIMEDRTNDGFGYTLITEEGFILKSLTCTVDI